MTPATLKSVVMRALQWRKTWLGLMLVCFVWLFGGAVVLPYALQQLLTTSWPAQTGRPVTVGAVRFNPWHWALTVEQFRIVDSDNTTLVSFDNLFVDYDMTSLFRLELGLDAVEWQKPYVKLAVDPAGVLGIQALVPPAKDPDPASQPAEIPAVLVKRVSIQELVVDYRDNHRATPFALQLDPVSFSLADFHTRDIRHNNLIEWQAHIAGDGRLDWKGQVRLDPLRVDGHLVLQDVALLPVLDLVLPDRRFVLQSALLDAEVAHHIEMNGALSATVQQAHVALRDIRIGNDQQSEPLVNLPSIVVDGIDVNVQEQAVGIASIQLADGKLRLIQGADGNINLQQLFAPANTGNVPPPAAAVVAEPAPPPWQVVINRLAMENYAVTVTDQKMSPPVEIALAPISFNASDIKPLAAEPVALQLSIGLPDAGELAVQANGVLSPLKLAADVQLKQLSLALAQPYVAQRAQVVIGHGTLEAGLQVEVAQQEQLQVTVKGSSAIRDLDIHEKVGKRKLVSWSALELADIAYSLTDNALSIDKVLVAKPYGRFIINKDGTTNIQQLLVQQPDNHATGKSPVVSASQSLPAPSAGSEVPRATPPFALAVRQVTVQDGDMGFADMTLRPDFRVAIEKLQGNINQISTDPAVMATVDLKGKVDRYAPATIRGTLNVLGKTPALDMAVAFKNIELTTFTPYSGTYAGFVIDKGQISVDLDYKLVNNRIAGKNRIVMNQLQLGQHVENEKAMDLPIRLALALLRDENGVIDLGFEVQGNVDEPSFSIGGLLLKVLGNIVMKAVTAPFSLISGLAAAPEESDRLAFAPGSAVLDAEGESKVAAVAGLLQKRATVQVNVRGNVLPDADRFALQQQRLAGQLAGETGLPAEQFLSPALAVEAGAPRRLVGRQLHALRNEELDDLEDRIREERQARQQGEDKKAVQLAAYEQAWARLAETVPVTDADLKQLAMARASRVKTVLMETHAIPPARVFVLDAANGDTPPGAVAILTLDAQ